MVSAGLQVDLAAAPVVLEVVAVLEVPPEHH